jgi:uncharacterized protein YdhG (YjbR/CyaY superfamily)
MKTSSDQIDAYIAAASPTARPALERIREIAGKAAPDAREAVSYRMPAFRGHGILIYFAAFKNHIGLFPPVKGDEALIADLAPYRGPKGNLQFPLGQPMPYDLIERVVRHQASQDAAKPAPRRRAKPTPA